MKNLLLAIVLLTTVSPVYAVTVNFTEYLDTPVGLYQGLDLSGWRSYNAEDITWFSSSSAVIRIVNDGMVNSIEASGGCTATFNGTPATIPTNRGIVIVNQPSPVTVVGSCISVYAITFNEGSTSSSSGYSSSSSSSSYSSNSSSSLPSSSSSSSSSDAYLFDGTNRVTVREMIGPLDVGAGDFAVEFEMRTNVSGPVIQCSQDGANYGAVIIDRDRLNQPRSYLVSLTESNIAFAIDGNVVRTICGATNVTDNNWHTIRAERSGSVMRLYVDGQLDASGDAPTSDIRCISESTTGDCDLVIGQEKWMMGYHYEGYVRNVRIYKEQELILELF